MTPSLEVTPTPALVDDHVEIVVRGVPSGETVTVRGNLTDRAGLQWESWADFRATAEGVVDLGSAAPLAGTYSGSDPEGLLWSMTPTDPVAASEQRTAGVPEAVAVRITVSRDGADLAAQEIVIGWTGPGVCREEVVGNGLKGALWIPAGQPPFRPVLVLGGSDGGLREETAALLASRGLLCLALAYFRYPGLPEELVDIPLEYFARGMALLGDDARADRSRGIGVVGRSRGGELALLLGATFEAIDAVVAYVPSGIVHAGISAGGNSWQSHVPSWTFLSKPIPYLSHLPMEPPAAEQSPAQRLTPIYCYDLREWATVQAASIPVEQSHARLLLISGTDDAMWPSSLMSELVVARLQRHGYRRPYQHLALREAGHRFGFPTLPATLTTGRHPADGHIYQYGGTPAGNVRAGRAAHKAVLEWLLPPVESSMA